MDRNYDVLLKSSWFASDIQEYYGISLSYANQIKTLVENESGVAPIYVDKERSAVCADDVIKYMGGKSRLEEAQIYNLLKERDV